MTDSSMKVMKIIHESVNERADVRVHSLTPFFVPISCLLGIALCLCADKV